MGDSPQCETDYEEHGYDKVQRVFCFVTIYVFSQGHDYLGRSSGPSSLQVFTHHLSSVAYIADFVPEGSSAVPVPALKIGAGTQLEDSEHEFLFTFIHVFSHGWDLT